MKRISIYLDEDQINFLVRESERKGMSIAKYIREIVQGEMAKEKEWRRDPFWKIGEDEFSTGNKRGSIEHDKVVYRPEWVNT
jgi:hypothetical protein